MPQPAYVEGGHRSAAIAAWAEAMDASTAVFLDAQLHRLEQSFALEGVPGYAYAVVKDGVIVAMEGGGACSLSGGEPVTSSTLFRVASLSKGMTGVLAAYLQEQGAFSWADPLGRFWAEGKAALPQHIQDLTLQQLLSHTTGLPRHTFSNLLNMDRPYPLILGMLGQVPLSHEPGTFHNYQNVAFNLAADFMEGACQEPFGQLLQVQLFKPLGMATAGCGLSHYQKAREKAKPHQKRADGYVEAEVSPGYYEVPAAAGVNASIKDMANWLQAMMGSKPGVLSQQALQEVFSPIADIPIGERSLRHWPGITSAHYGLGWRLIDWQGTAVHTHSGYVDGFRAEIGFLPKEDIGIVVLSNGANHTVGAFVPAFLQGYLERFGPQS